MAAKKTKNRSAAGGNRSGGTASAHRRAGGGSNKRKSTKRRANGSAAATASAATKTTPKRRSNGKRRANGSAARRIANGFSLRGLKSAAVTTVVGTGGGLGTRIAADVVTNTAQSVLPNVVLLRHAAVRPVASFMIAMMLTPRVFGWFGADKDAQAAAKLGGLIATGFDALDQLIPNAEQRISSKLNFMSNGALALNPALTMQLPPEQQAQVLAGAQAGAEAGAQAGAQAALSGFSGDTNTFEELPSFYVDDSGREFDFS